MAETVETAAVLKPLNEWRMAKVLTPSGLRAVPLQDPDENLATDAAFEPFCALLTMPQYCQIAPRQASRRQIRIEHRTLPALELVSLWCARFTLLALLCIAPWCFGGVELDTQVWLDRGLLVSLACWIVALSCSALAGSGSAIRLPTLLIPLISVLILGTAQLAPRGVWGARSDAAVVNGSPDVTRLPVRNLIPDQHNAQSIYPASTRLEIARLGMAIIACYLGIVLFADPRSQVWLWAAFALNGAALSFFGIVQQLSWNGKLFWTVPLLLGGQPFASFVNRNNAAGYLNICLAAAVGLIIWSIFRVARRSYSTDRRNLETDRRNPEGLGTDLPRPRSVINEFSATSVVLASMIAAGIICSVSRGGVLALVVAALLLLLCTFRTRIGLAVGSLCVGVMLLGIGLVLWTGQEERFLVRWNSSSGDTIESGAQTRLANWRDALKAAQDFPTIGTGFGTYSFAYLPYQSWHAPVRFYNADNQFVECLVEGGGIGLGLLLLSIALWISSAAYLVRFDHHSPCAVVGLFTIASQIVSAFFDFGPTMSANMLALAVFAGATTGRAAAVASQMNPGGPCRWLALPDLTPIWIPITVAMALLGFGLVQLGEVAAAADCRVAHRDLPKRLDLADAMAAAPLDIAIQQLTTSLQGRPDDAEAHSSLARLLIYRYRQQTYRELTDFHKRGGPAPSWAMTDTMVLYARRNQWRNNNEQTALDELRSLPVIKDNLAPAYRHLLAARTAAPLMPGLDVGIATLALILDDDEAVARSALRRAVALNPADTAFIDWCGALAGSAGLSSQAGQ